MDRAHRFLAVGLMLVCAALIATALPVSAESHTLEPGITYEVIEHADSMAYINYSWSVNPPGASIHFVVLDPEGSVLVDTVAGSYDSFLLSIDSGNYKFRWTSSESSPVNLNYNIISQSTGINDGDRIFDTVFLVLLVGAVVVVIIVLLVIIVVMRGGRKVQPPVIGHPSKHAPPGEAPSPYVPGMCPRCGSPFDSQHTYCPKCGHRVR